jgi:hypothetical protein
MCAERHRDDTSTQIPPFGILVLGNPTTCPGDMSPRQMPSGRILVTDSKHTLRDYWGGPGRVEHKRDVRGEPADANRGVV